MVIVAACHPLNAIRANGCGCVRHMRKVSGGMFCLGCGAEAPMSAVKCSVCGRDLGRPTGETQFADSTLPVFSPTASYPRYTVPTMVPAIPAGGAAGARGALDKPGLPSDTYSRAALVTVGAPALLVLLTLGAAALPLFNSAWRRKPVYAVLPMIAGSLSVGGVCTLWVVLTYLSYQISVVGAAVSSGAVPASTPPSSFFPDVGIYLFLLGGGVLTFTGYHVFLAAVSETSRGAISFTAAPAFTPPSPSPAPQTIPPYLQPQLGMTPIPAPASAPLPASASRPLAGISVPHGNGNADGQAAALGVSRGSVETTSALAMPDGVPQEGAKAAAQGAASRVPLPGSAEWSEAPRQPEYMRPSLGWQRGPRVRR